MKCIGCFNLEAGGKACKVLKVEPCPKDCFAKVTDPREYIKTLESLIYYNWDTNLQMVADLRKEVKQIREDFNLGEPEYEKDFKAGKFADWKQCYYEDLKRRSAKGGGASEKNTNPSKPRENDNRILETKLTSAEREELKKATEEWELEHGKLDKLGYTSMSRSKIDSYTGEPIE